VLSILNCCGGGGGTSEDGGDGGEVGDCVGGVGIHRILFLIRWTALHSVTFVSSSSSPHGDEIKGLVSSPLFPLFL